MPIADVASLVPSSHSGIIPDASYNSSVKSHSITHPWIHSPASHIIHPAWSHSITHSSHLAESVSCISWASAAVHFHPVHPSRIRLIPLMPRCAFRERLNAAKSIRIIPVIFIVFFICHLLNYCFPFIPAHLTGAAVINWFIIDNSNHVLILQLSGINNSLNRLNVPD